MGFAAMFVTIWPHILATNTLNNIVFYRFSTLLGIGGGIIGMAQDWFVGPLAAKLGPHGTDIGFEMAAVVAAVFYPPLRLMEIRKWGR